MALSLGSPPPGVTRHRVTVEPGLSSPIAPRGDKSGHPAVWPGQSNSFCLPGKGGPGGLPGMHDPVAPGFLGRIEQTVGLFYELRQIVIGVRIEAGQTGADGDEFGGL